MLGLSARKAQTLTEEKKKVLIVVDAVNELEGAAALSLGWLPVVGYSRHDIREAPIRKTRT